jgi:AraC-like DNA-binding protein
MPDDWVRYWRARSLPIEAMHARFTTHVYHRHSHESYSLGITEEGAQEFRCRHGRHVSGPGMVMLFNPDDPHDGHAADAGGFTYRMVHVWPDLMASLVGEVTGRADGLPLFPVPVAQDAALARALRRLAATLEPDSGAGGELARYERLADVSRHVARHASYPRPAPRPAPADMAADVAARVRDLIHDAGGAPPPGSAQLTMGDLAEAAGCSRYAAYRAFRGAFGMAPSDYQRQLRIRAARRLLAAGTAPAIAAAEAGFADQAHLTRWFRRYYGVTPAAFQAAVTLPAGGCPRRPGPDVGEPAPAEQQRPGSQP